MKKVVGTAVLSVLLVSMGLSAPMAFAKDSFGAPIATEKERAQVARGMTQAQVSALLGQPLKVQGYSRDSDTTWVYEAVGTVFQAKDPRFLIHFARDGKVSSTQVIELGTN